jgi:phytoene dehydrogenase-like protein
VIGAGHNGLVAANLLADAGWSVVVCEATSFTGGAVRSAEITAPGFLSDLFSAFYPLTAASPVVTRLHLENHGLRWTHAPAVLAHVFPDDRCAVLYRDADRTADSLGQFDRADGPAWHALVRQWDRIGPTVIEALLRPFPPVRPASRLLRQLGLSTALQMARMAIEPVRRFGEETFRGEGGPILLAGNALHADLAPEGAGSAAYGWLLCMLGASYGFPVPVGGAGRLADALVDRFEAKGGEIRRGAPVERVTVSSGRATGVVLASGELLRARRAVLAAVNAPVLFQQMVGAEHLPSAFLTDLERFQWDAPTLKLNWALSAPVPWTATEARSAGTVHLGVDMDGLTDYAADLATRRLPRAPFLLFGQMTTADPSRSPAGTESAWAYTHVPAGLLLDRDRLEPHVELIEHVIERHAPGFRELIVGRHVQSPAGLEEHNPNLVNGAINGGTAQLHQQLVFRPVPGLANAETPIDRLYLAGSSAHPGGGVHGAPGSNAAHAALRRDRFSGGVRRAATGFVLRRIYPDARDGGSPKQR